MENSKMADDGGSSLDFERIIDVARPLQLQDGKGPSGRTCDVTSSMASTFEELMLSSPVLSGLRAAGFRRPSPVQLNAIPLGKLGLDLVVQAKSGTGKTLVFVLLALEAVDVDVCSTQVLMVAPTREIANQIAQTIAAVTKSESAFKKLKYRSFIGGTPLRSDMEYLKSQKCQIVVGTPGRLRQLSSMQALLPLENCRLLVLDEADKLMEGDFQPDVNHLFSLTPSTGKQVIVLSATYPRSLDQFLAGYMQSPTLVRALDAAGDVQLIGVKQYVCMCQNDSFAESTGQDFVPEAKLNALLSILKRVGYSQAMVFCSTQRIASDTSEWLLAQCIDSMFISGGRGQAERTQVMKQLRQYTCRLLVSTDLTARGIDAPNVDLILNLCLPADTATYFHRIGRSGRFGSYGAAVTLVDSKDLYRLARMNSRNELSKLKLLDCARAPFDLCTDEEHYNSARPCRLPQSGNNGFTPKNGLNYDNDDSCTRVCPTVPDSLSRVESESDSDCLVRIGLLLEKLQRHTARIECNAIDPQNIAYTREEMLKYCGVLQSYMGASADFKSPSSNGFVDSELKWTHKSSTNGVPTPTSGGSIRQKRYDEMLEAMSLEDIPLPRKRDQSLSPVRRNGNVKTKADVKFSADPFAPIDDMAFWADSDFGSTYPAVNVDELASENVLDENTEVASDSEKGHGATVVFYGSPVKPPITPAADDLYEVPDYHGNSAASEIDEKSEQSSQNVDQSGDNVTVSRKHPKGHRYTSNAMRRILKGRTPPQWWALGDQLFNTSEPPFVGHFRQRATRTVLISRWRRREIDIPDFCWPFWQRDLTQDRPLASESAAVGDGEEHAERAQDAVRAVQLDSIEFDTDFMDNLDNDAERFVKVTGGDDVCVWPSAGLTKPLDYIPGARYSVSDSALLAASQVCATLDENAVLRRITDDLLNFGISVPVDQSLAGGPGLEDVPTDFHGPPAQSESEFYESFQPQTTSSNEPMLLFSGPPGIAPFTYDRLEMLRIWTHATVHGTNEAQTAERVLSRHGIFVRRCFSTRHNESDCDTCALAAGRLA